MDVNKQIEYWVKTAEESLLDAESLISTKRYLFALFCCHLTIEKILKAHVVKHTQEIPLKTHHLLNLLKKTEIIINDDDKLFLGELMEY